MLFGGLRGGLRGPWSRSDLVGVSQTNHIQKKITKLTILKMYVHHCLHSLYLISYIQAVAIVEKMYGLNQPNPSEPLCDCVHPIIPDIGLMDGGCIGCRKCGRVTNAHPLEGVDI